MLNSFFAPESWNRRSTSQARWRRTWTQLARAQAGGLAARSVNILLGTGSVVLDGACPGSEGGQTPRVDAVKGVSPQAPRACLAGRLRDFATNRHE